MRNNGLLLTLYAKLDCRELKPCSEGMFQTIKNNHEHCGLPFPCASSKPYLL